MFQIALAEEVDFERGVDSNQPRQVDQRRQIVCDLRTNNTQILETVQRLIQVFTADQDRGQGDEIRIKRARFGELKQPIREHARMQAQLAVIAQQP